MLGAVEGRRARKSVHEQKTNKTRQQKSHNKTTPTERNKEKGTQTHKRKENMLCVCE